MKKIHCTSHIVPAFAAAILLAGNTSTLHSAPVTDFDVPVSMNAGGTSGDPAEYIVGFSGGPDTVTLAGTTMVGQTTSYNNLTVQNGWTLSSQGATVGSDSTSSNNHVTVTGAGSTWNTSGAFYVGRFGANNSLSVLNGGSFTVGSGNQVYIGSGATSNNNTLSLSGAAAGLTVAGNNARYVGQAGSGNSLIIQNGASFTQSSGQLYVGTLANANNNSLTVSGSNTRATYSSGGAFRIGNTGATANTGNNVTLQNGGLLQVTNTSAHLVFTVNTDNYVRLDDGFLGLAGNHTSYLNGMIDDQKIQLWNGSTWFTAATDTPNLTVTYFNAGQAADAEAFTGYSGLGNYTIMHYAIPEPGVATLFLAGLGSLLAVRRRRNT